MNTKNLQELIIQNEVENNNRTCKCIAVLTGRFLPKLCMANNYTIDLLSMQKRLQDLDEGGWIVFGRDRAFCDIIVSNTDRTISRVHCYIKKCENKFQIFDCSLNGTRVVF